MFGRERGALKANAAMNALDRGDLVKAQNLIEQARVLLAQQRDSVLRDADLGNAERLQANVYLERGDIESALRHLDRAERYLLTERCLSRQVGREDASRFLYDTSITLAELGRAKDAHDYRKRADELAQGSELMAKLTSSRVATSGAAEILVGDDSTDAADIARLRTLASHSVGADRLGAHGNLITGLLLSSSHRYVMEGCRLLPDWWLAARESVNIDAATRPAVALANLYDVDVSPHVATLTKTTTDMANAAAAQHNRMVEAQVRVASSAIYAGSALWPQALSESSMALVLASVGLGSQTSSALRNALVELDDRARHIACLAAFKLNMPQLLAELIEHSRVQALPADTKPASVSSVGASGRVLETGYRVFEKQHWVSVDGRSHLGEIAASRGFEAETSALDAVFQTQTGDNRSWLGIWLSGGSSFSAFRDDVGAWDLRYIESQLVTWLETNVEPLFDIQDTSSDLLTLLKEDLYRSTDSERSAMAEAGQMLLPTLLIEQARRNLTDSTPSTLILSADRLMVTLPVPALCVEIDSEPVRLVQAFDLLATPPVRIWEQLSSERGDRPQLGASFITCLNPTGDLQNAYAVPPQTTLLLTHESLTSAFGRPSAHATTENLGAAFSREANALGALFYAGHTCIGEIDEPLNGALVLQDGSVTARTILEDDWQFPQRVLMSSCSSSGGPSLMTGEWLGLPTALMLSGARELLVTNWSLLDTEFTEQFESRLCNRLLDVTPLHKSLSQAQREALEQWSRRSEGADSPQLPDQFTTAPFPMIWGSYVCVGV